MRLNCQVDPEHDWATVQTFPGGMVQLSLYHDAPGAERSVSVVLDQDQQLELVGAIALAHQGEEP